MEGGVIVFHRIKDIMYFEKIMFFWLRFKMGRLKLMM